MKYISGSIVVLMSVCAFFLVVTDSSSIGAYIGLIVVAYGILLLFNAHFRKAFKNFFIKKGTFGNGNKIYGEIHLENLKTDIENIEPLAFEHFVSDLFKGLGYKTKVTDKTKDFGGDILIKKNRETTIIQVKHRKDSSDTVSNDAVQQAVAAMSVYGATRSMVVTNGKFTEHAYKQADYSRTAMIDGNQLLNLVRQVIAQETKLKDKEEELKLITNKGSGTKEAEDLEEITKVDCLDEQLENVLADTLLDVTLEGAFQAETISLPKELLQVEQEKEEIQSNSNQSDASNS